MLRAERARRELSAAADEARRGGDNVKKKGTRRNARQIRARWRLQADRGEQSSSFPWPHGRRARAATKIRSYESRSRRWRGRPSLESLFLERVEDLIGSL